MNVSLSDVQKLNEIDVAEPRSYCSLFSIFQVFVLPAHMRFKDVWDLKTMIWTANQFVLLVGNIVLCTVPSTTCQLHS